MNGVIVRGKQTYCLPVERSLILHWARAGCVLVVYLMGMDRFVRWYAHLEGGYDACSHRI